MPNAAKKLLASGRAECARSRGGEWNSPVRKEGGDLAARLSEALGYAALTQPTRLVRLENHFTPPTVISSAARNLARNRPCTRNIIAVPLDPDRITLRQQKRLPTTFFLLARAQFPEQHNC